METKAITHRKIETATRPVKPDDYRDHYYPKTEILGDDEMRVTASGTGMPNLRPSQASAAWLVELGNGDTFFFYIGTGAIAGFASTLVSYNRANRVFLSRLHSDHCGDVAALWVGDWVAGCQIPLYVWGPSGDRRELGTRHFIDKMREAYQWDIKTRMMVAVEDVWPPESAKDALDRDRVASFSGRGWKTDPEKMADWLIERQLHFDKE